MNDVPSFYDIKHLAEDVRDKAVEAYMAENQRARNAMGESAGHYAATSSRAEERFEGLTEYIVPWFQECAVANPDELRPLIDDLDAVLSQLDSDMIVGNVAKVQDKVSGWEGEGAQSFTSLSLKDFLLIRDNQRVILGVMIVSLEANVALLEQCRRDVKNIGEKTKDVLAEFTGDGGGSGEVAATVLGAIVGAAVTVATEGVGVKLAAQAAVGTASVVEKVLRVDKGENAETGEYKISGDTVDDVLTSMNDALSTVWRTVADGEREIAARLQEAKDSIEAGRYEDYEPKRPAIADVSGADLLSSDKGVGLYASV